MISDIEHPLGTCEGYPEQGCANEATNTMLGWNLCDACARIFSEPDPQPVLRIEGNGGGDYLSLQSVGDNRVRLEVGSCCVTTIRHIVPIEFITAMLVDAAIKHGSIQAAIQATSWPQEFKDTLVAQVEEAQR
jgi:hypothetical protein